MRPEGIGFSQFNAGAQARPGAWSRARQAAGNFRDQVNRYDQAASQPDHFTERWATGAMKWGARSVAGRLADIHMPDTGIPYQNRMLETLNPLTEGSQSYRSIMGLRTGEIRIGTNGDFNSYRSFLSQEGWEALKDCTKYNFENVRLHNLSRVFSIDFFKRTLQGYNLEGLRTPLAEGKGFTFGAGVLGFGLLGWNILSGTYSTYQSSIARGDSTFTTIKKTAKTLIGETVKAGICWELGSIGFALGSAALAVGTFPALIAGVVVGSLFSAAGHYLLSKIIPNPPSPVSNAR